MGARREHDGAVPRGGWPCHGGGTRGAPEGESERAGQRECRWQREQFPDAIRALVIDDQRVRNAICWSVFDC
jgi:hypothetical protein